MFRRSIVVAVMMAMAVMLAACNSAGSGLTGKIWQLASISEKVPAFQGVIPEAEQSKYTVEFASDGTFSGTADCNQIAGTYKTSGSNGITITPGPSTLAFCGEGSFDALFTHALARAETYAASAAELTVNLKDGGILSFVAAPEASPSAGASASPAASASAAASAAASASPSPSPKPSPSPTPKPTPTPTAKPTPTPSPGASSQPSTGLTGKTWQLVAITLKDPAFQGNVPADQQADYTVTFNADRSFSAKADCNTVNGTYDTGDPSAASGNLTITPAMSTSAACPEGSLADLYVLGLSSSASYAIANGQLTITLTDDGTLQYQ